MPTNGLLLLLDRPTIKGMHICWFCILMQLLTHYDHVIVQSLIVHPVCVFSFFNQMNYLNNGDIVMCKSTFTHQCSLLEGVRGQGTRPPSLFESWLICAFMCLVLCHLFSPRLNVPAIRISYSFCILHLPRESERERGRLYRYWMKSTSISECAGMEDNYWFEIRKDKAQPWAARR